MRYARAWLPAAERPASRFGSYTSQTAAQGHGLATGYRLWFVIPVATDLAYSAAFRSTGGLISTSEDLAHYLVAQLNGGRYGGASVLSPVGLAEQHRPAVRTGDGEVYYGMGWQTGAIGDIPIVEHDGMLPTGYAGCASLYFMSR